MIVWIVLIFLEQKIDLPFMKKHVEINEWSKKNELLTFNQYMKLDKMSYITYAADIESLIKKVDG